MFLVYFLTKSVGYILIVIYTARSMWILYKNNLIKICVKMSVFFHCSLYYTVSKKLKVNMGVT